MKVTGQFGIKRVKGISRRSSGVSGLASNALIQVVSVF